LAFDGDFGNNLMINFMAAMFLRQALACNGKEYSSPHRGCIQARKYTTIAPLLCTLRVI
jgi:hypothetical protein